jgi:hypothetical protein
MAAPSLNFKRGIDFEDNIWLKFGHLVNHVAGDTSRDFLLVASFSRSHFRLNMHTVGIVLQSCFGGLASLFKVQLLKDRSFRFSVASKSVGFQIYNSGKTSEVDFDISFNLWGNGGPNWLVEEQRYYKEQDSSWTFVLNSKQRVSAFERLKFPKQAMQTLIPIKSIFQRLNFESSHFAGKAGSEGIQKVSHSLPRPTYAQAVTDSPKLLDLARKDVRRQTGQISLPGLIPSIKWPSFLAPDILNWPDSCRNWFKAQGPALKPIYSTRLKDFAEFFSQFSGHSSFASLSPPPIVNPNASSPAQADSGAMANILIDPRPFVPPGFQIQHVEGRTAIHRVVVPRRTRQNEEVAIASITPMPPGQVDFANVHDVLDDFLAHVAHVGF